MADQQTAAKTAPADVEDPQLERLYDRIAQILAIGFWASIGVIVAGLLLALVRGEEISDFPLCNKSFNLSYCGFDL